MIILFLFFFFGLSYGQDALVIDYKGAYDLALRNNKDILRLKHQIEGLELDYQLAQKYYLPTVYAGASLLYDMDKKKTDANLNISIISTLYEFQKTRSRVELSRLRREMAQVMLEQLHRDIQLRIIQLFSEAQLYKKLTEVKREEMAIAYVRFDRAREKKELGLSTDHEVYRLEAVYREKRAELLYAQHMYNYTLLQIKQLCGIPLNALLQLKDLPLPDPEKLLVDFTRLREEALKNNASLRIKNLELRSYEEEIRIAGQVFSPRVILRVGTDKSGLELTTPFYEAGRGYKVDRLTSLRRSAIAEKEKIEQEVSFIFLSAAFEWDYLKALWAEALAKDRFAEENLILRRSEYELELAFDLGYAMAEKSEAERRLLQSYHMILIFWARLLNLAGREPFSAFE